MKTPEKPGHASREDIIDYFQGVLSEDEQIRLEEHFAECLRCTKEARLMNALENVYQQWNARTMSEAKWALTVLEGLEAVTRSDPDPVVRERIERWAKNWEGKARAAVRVVVGTSGAAFRAVTQRLDDLLAPLPPRVALRGATESRKGPEIEVVQEGRELIVRSGRKASRGGSPLAVVIPVGGSQAASAKVLEPQPGQNAFSARFRVRSGGEYIVVVEPREEG